MNSDGKNTKLDPEAERKVIAESVKKMNGEMPEVFGYLDPGITTIPELINALQQQTAIGERYYAKLKKAQDDVSS